MKTKKRKKYATGTPIIGAIENPETALQQNDINLAQASYAGETDPAALILNGLAALTAQVGPSIADSLNKGGKSGNFGSGKTSSTTSIPNVSKSIENVNSNLFPGFDNNLKPLYLALGGQIPNVPAEIEGGEVGETPNGQVFEAKGPSHEQGGIDINLPEMTEMFSKRIKVDGKTMADRKKKRAKKEMSLKELLEKRPTGVPLKNALKRTKEVNTKEEGFDKGIQQLVSMIMNKSKGKKYRNGGPVEDGVPDPRLWAQALFGKELPKQSTDLDYIGMPLDVPSDTYTESNKSSVTKTPKVDDTYKLPISSMSSKDINMNNIPGLDTNPEPVAYSDNIFENMSTDKIDKTKIPNFLKGFTAGDGIGMAGDLISTLGPLLNTLHNRATDTPNINPYEGYGEKGLQTIDNTGQYFDQLKEQELKDLGIVRNTNVKIGRNTARGVNTMRALDLAADENTNKAQVSVYDNFAKQMAQLMFNKAQLENNQDATIDKGKWMQSVADKQDKDAYSSALAHNLSNLGKGVQTIGARFNQIKSGNEANDAIAKFKHLFKNENDFTTFLQSLSKITGLNYNYVPPKTESSKKGSKTKRK